MDGFFAAFGVGLSAFAIWLAVRIVNRRERWVRRTALWATVLVVLYPLSFGPVCWAHSRYFVGTSAIQIIYWPIITYAAHFDRPCADQITQFAKFGAAKHVRPIFTADGKLVWQCFGGCMFALSGHFGVPRESSPNAKNSLGSLSGYSCSLRRMWSRSDDLPQETPPGILGNFASILLPGLHVAFAAFCVWLPVRVFNRRERWAKQTLAAVVMLPLLYVVSFGPACWLVGIVGLPRLGTARFYRPLVRVVNAESRPLSAILGWYAGLGDVEISRTRILDVDTSTAAEMGSWLDEADSPPLEP
jgi:hypothetical protein